MFERLDVVLSNAGYGHQGAVEEVTETEARAQMEANFIGTLWDTQAALPIMRAQKSGHLLAVSSVLGADRDESAANPRLKLASSGGEGGTEIPVFRDGARRLFV
jgi:NAD(P)-dependent dehydrogenase (short-subunit alcohol dehydrogenase family)